MLRIFFLLTYLAMTSLSLAEFSDEIVAIVGSRPITRSLVKSTMEVFNIKDEEEALDFIINSFVVLDYASRRGINISDDEVERMMKISGANDRISLENSLLSLGMTLDEYKNFVRARYITDQIFLELGGNFLISDQELYNFYQKEKKKIKEAFERRYVLYIEDVQDMEHYNMQDFKSLGWVRKGELLPDFEEAIFSSPSTGITSVKRGDKIFIFFVKDIDVPSFPYLKNTTEFREFYIKEKYKEVFGKWVDTQKQKIFVKVKDQTKQNRK